MKSIQVFDQSIMCCNSGGCGGEVNQQLIDFAADVDWAKQNGAQIERFDLTQQPIAFANNRIVKDYLERSGKDVLPLILVNGELILAGRYPNRFELANLAEIAQPIAEIKPIDGCCDGGKCCEST